MSRAFVNEDVARTPEPSFDLPDPESGYYDEAAAWALVQGADAPDPTDSDPGATGCPR